MLGAATPYLSQQRRRDRATPASPPRAVATVAADHMSTQQEIGYDARALRRDARIERMSSSGRYLGAVNPSRVASTAASPRVRTLSFRRIAET